MPSLGQLYNDKDAGLTTRKTYNVPLDKIYAEEGYNVRELNRAHVEEFRDAFIAGEYIPPLAVEVTERGVKVIDGHHRYWWFNDINNSYTCVSTYHLHNVWWFGSETHKKKTKTCFYA